MRIRVVSLSLAVIFLGACATRPAPVWCGLAGALAGAGGGAAINANNAEGDDSREAWEGAGIGAAVGAIAAYAVCSFIPERREVAQVEPPPPPPPPAPEPEPEPAPPPPPVEEPERIVLRGVNFEFDRAQIRPDAEVILDEAARILEDRPDVRVRIEGHTDAVGPESYNQRLSERRAEAVQRYFVEQGLDPQRFETVGLGESEPVAPNDTREGRALNRRVELEVTER